VLLAVAVTACGGKSEPATTPANTADTGGETYGGETYGDMSSGYDDGGYGGGAYGGYTYGGGQAYTPRHYDTPALSRAECEAYVKKMEAYLACPKVPKDTVEGAKQGIDAMKQAWAQWDQMPVEAQDAAADACRQAIDALTQGAQAMDCTI
jgi:hypothetical protein